MPLVKYCMRAVAHVLYLLLYAEVLTHLLTVEQLDSIAPRMPPLTGAELVLVIWSLTLGYEHRQRDYLMRTYGLYAASFLKSLVNTVRPDAPPPRARPLAHSPRALAARHHAPIAPAARLGPTPRAHPASAPLTLDGTAWVSALPSALRPPVRRRTA